MKTSFLSGLFAGLVIAVVGGPVLFFLAHQLGWWSGMPSRMGDGQHAPMMQQVQAAEPARMSVRLRSALTAGDAQAVANLLDPQVVIYESGGVESDFAEYAAHHLPADMAFMQGVKHDLLDEYSRVFGNQAVYWGRSRVRGTYKDKPVDLYSNETLWLQRVEGQWRIRHIHWSSRSAS